MKSETRLPLAIFAALAVLILVPWIMSRVHEARRPMLVEVRVVTATAADPVHRDGHRRLVPGENVDIALALRLAYPDGADVWLSPADVLVLGDLPVDHRKTETWAEEDRSVRVFWFTIESSFLGGELSRENAAARLEYRSFIAPELGSGLRAEGFPEAHNDDQIGVRAGHLETDSGTTRLYARVEVLADADDVRAAQTVTSAGVEALDSPDLVTLFRAADFTDPIHAAAGELFRLPGFEPADDPPGTWNDVPMDALGLHFTELVEHRLATSSRTFASMALTGSPSTPDDRFQQLGTLSASDGSIRVRGQAMQWNKQVRAGDILLVDRRWIVLLADDGTGDLDGGDTAMLCWKGPPALLDVASALGDGRRRVTHLRTVAGTEAP